MEGKHGQGYRCATHITKVFVKRTILFLQCGYFPEVSCAINSSNQFLFSLSATGVALHPVVAICSYLCFTVVKVMYVGLYKYVHVLNKINRF